MNVLMLPFYNIVNILFVGVLFCVGIGTLFPGIIELFGSDKLVSIKTDSFLFCMIALTVVYEIGIVLDRLGSLVTERVLKNKKPANERGFISNLIQMQWKCYHSFQKAEKHSENIKTLTREYIFSRNNLTLFAILAVVALCVGRFIHAIIFADLVILFYFSMKKHADKVAQRVDYANGDKPTC